VLFSDRFLLYTDGVIESGSASGDSFGDCKLEQVVRPPSELVDQLLFEIRHWRPESLRVIYRARTTSGEETLRSLGFPGRLRRPL
jgi:Stage II sporulation protein E (SpoIIE)